MATCPRLISDYFTPQVIWYQTDHTVTVRIQLTDISNYYLEVNNEYLMFRTTKDGKQYYLVLHLFGPVIAEKTVNINVGREIKVHLMKALKCFPWLRLISSKDKNLPIVYSLDNIEYEMNSRRDQNEDKSVKFYFKKKVPDESIENQSTGKTLQKSTKKQSMGNLLPEGISSDNESDEDDLLDEHFL